MRRIRKQLLCGLAVALSVCVAPASASADRQGRAAIDGDDFWGAQLRYAGEFGGFRIAAAAGAGPNDDLTISYLATPSPDILFLSPGGIAPPPMPCIAGSPQLVRCPATGLTGLDVFMGTGNDRVDTSSYSSPTVAGFTMTIRTGPGKDRWLGGPLGEFWIGGPGGDFANGQEGNDRFVGGSGNDRIAGGPGNDIIRCGRGLGDQFSDGPGRDRVYISACEIRRHGFKF